MSSDTSTGRVRKRYECGDCGAWQWVRVRPGDSEQPIRVGCPECNNVTEHDPAGLTDWFGTRA